MNKSLLNQALLENKDFWSGKKTQLPQYDRHAVPVKSLCFSAGRMAYGHTADILQDILNADPRCGMMAGIETYASRYCLDLAASDYLMTQLVFGSGENDVTARIQGAIKTVHFVDDSTQSMTWARLMEYARDPQVQFATINAPEGVYGVSYTGGDFAEPVNDRLISDMKNGTVTTDPARWTAFARERYAAALPFALVSCTNFSGNGHYTGATVRAVARAWEDNGFAPAGFVDYLSDPKKFSFPNTMIDRIAVAPDERSLSVLADDLGIVSTLVVTEEARYWAVEDLFPAGRPDFEKASGVFMCPDYEDVKRYEDMKLRILNMSHSVIAGLGVLLGYRGSYGIYKAMQDKDLTTLITRIIELVIKTIDKPQKLDPETFARDAMTRLNNPNIPDDPMRIALNGSTKMLPRFLDTYYAAQKIGISDDLLDSVLVPVAGFLRYTLAVDDCGQSYTLEGDPARAELEKAGKAATVGEPASSQAFDSLISHADIMGKNLFEHGNTGTRLQELVSAMLEGDGAVRKTIRAVLS